jgi:hypothetical protein
MDSNSYVGGKRGRWNEQSHFHLISLLILTHFTVASLTYRNSCILIDTRVALHSKLKGGLQRLQAAV